MNFREEMLNKLLGHAWEQYAARLESGEKVELESSYEDWVSTALEDNIKTPLNEAS